MLTDDQTRDGYTTYIFTNISVLPIAYFLFFVFSSRFGIYEAPSEYTIYRIIYLVSKVIFATFSTLIGIIFILKINYFNQEALKIQILLVWIGISLLRVQKVLSHRAAIKSGKDRLEILVIGTGNRAKHLVNALQKGIRWGVNIVGFLDSDQSMVGSTIVEGKKVIGTIQDIHDTLKSHVVDEVIIAIPRAMISNMDAIAIACEQEGVRLRVMVDFFDVTMARIRYSEIESIPILTLDPVAHDELFILAKRIFDFIVTLSAMPIMLLVMGAVSIAVKLDSRGPIFFKQMRVGKNKRLFNMYKFRSMYVGSDAKIDELEHLNEANGPIFKIANDPRVTRVGRFIRKYSLDELPQLFNVLRGDMSLVGPRPMSVRDVNLFDKGIQRKRFSMKPGLTCLWQISGRSSLPFDKWLELDLKYIENWSFFKDIVILVKTIPVVIAGSGAM